MPPVTVVLTLTPAQARMVNAALAFYEAEDHEGWGYRQDVMDRTRRVVHQAMERAGVEA